jgi:hypothetical protein
MFLCSHGWQKRQKETAPRNPNSGEFQILSIVVSNDLKVGLSQVLMHGPTISMFSTGSPQLGRHYEENKRTS